MGKVKFLDLSCAATKQQITRCTCLLKRKNICAKIKCQFTWTEKSIFRFRKSNTKYLKYFISRLPPPELATNRSLPRAPGASFPPFSRPSCQHDFPRLVVVPCTTCTRFITCSITYSTTCSISSARLSSRNSPALRNETKGS